MKMKCVKIIIITISIFLMLKQNIVINISPSMTRGIYLKEKDTNIKKGDTVIFEIPDGVKDIIYKRNYISKNVKTLLKKVVGTEEDCVCIVNNKVYVNGKYIKKRKQVDSKGLPLPQIELNKINEDEFLLFGDSKNSLDSIYFGTVKKERIVSKVKLIIPFEKEDRLILEKL